MAQHDYVIDNSTGANVRADINSVLQAIASNNSGSSAPSTTFALQFYADTTNNILKLRNAANNGYVNLFSLAGGVDVDAASNFNEDVTFTTANGNNILFDKSENILKLGDNVKLNLGDSSDGQLFHDGTNTILAGGTDLLLRPASGSNDIIFQPNSGAETMLKATVNGATELYFDNTKRLETTTSGASVSGALSVSNGISLPDLKELKLGDNNDLIIVHTGFASYINNNSGDLYIRNDNANDNANILIQARDGENSIYCHDDGAVELYHDASKKFETSSNGINMVDKVITFQGQSNRNIRFRDGENDMIFEFDAGDFYRQDIGNSAHEFFTTNNKRLTIDSSGNIGAPSGTNIYNASDSRVKKNVENIDKGLSTINSLRPISFNWIDGFCDTEKNTLYGFIAQEVQTVDNNLIQDFSKEITVEDTKIENVLTVNEKFIIPILVKAIQELSAKVAALEAA